MNNARRIGSALLLLSGIACSSQEPAPTVRRAAAPQVKAQVAPRVFTVPATAPDSVPRNLFTDEELDHEGMLQYPRDILVLQFKSTATRLDRQNAIDLVHGKVVGGFPSGDREGFYIVRLPDDRTLKPLFAALDTLNKLLGQGSAAPYMLVEAQEHRAHSK